MELKIEVSDGAYRVIERFAQAWEQNVDEFVLDKFKTYEIIKDKPEVIEKYVNNYKRKVQEKRLKEWYSKHKIKRYRLKTFKDGSELVLSWYSARLPDSIIASVSKDKRDHIGEYWSKIERVKVKQLIRGVGINSVLKSEDRYFKTMKALKNFVNRQFVNNGYDKYYGN